MNTLNALYSVYRGAFAQPKPTYVCYWFENARAHD